MEKKILVKGPTSGKNISYITIYRFQQKFLDLSNIRSGWTLPLDIIAVMITYGGSNAMICHGAGIKNKTLSDLVLK